MDVIAEDFIALENLILDVKGLPTFEQAQRFYSVLKGRGEEALSDFFQENDIFQVWNEEFIEGLVSLIKGLETQPILEICAGNGKLGYHLQQRGINLHMTDDGSWHINSNGLTEKLDYNEALKKYEPQLVIAAWPEQWTRIKWNVLDFPTLKYFITIDNPYYAGVDSGEIELYRERGAEKIEHLNDHIIVSPHTFPYLSKPKAYVFLFDKTKKS